MESLMECNLSPKLQVGWACCYSHDQLQEVLCFTMHNSSNTAIPTFFGVLFYVYICPLIVRILGLHKLDGASVTHLLFNQFCSRAFLDTELSKSLSSKVHCEAA